MDAIIKYWMNKEGVVGFRADAIPYVFKGFEQEFKKREGGENLTETHNMLREISNNIRYLSDNLKDHPSDLLFSEPPPKSETLK